MELEREREESIDRANRAREVEGRTQESERRAKMAEANLIKRPPSHMSRHFLARDTVSALAEAKINAPNF